MQKTSRLNKNIILLGIVSFLTDISSEMIFSVFAIFFTTILRASTAILGIVEGLADFSASSLDYAAGFLSDKSGKRKPFAILGYGFSTTAKIILVFANSVLLASLFRVIERLGKSLRGPPRDAWISAYATKQNRGLAFGVHKALDKTGAILGPLVAYALLNYFGQNAQTFKLIFKIAIIPAIISVILLALIKDKQSKPQKKENIFTAYKTLSKAYKHYFYTAGIFSLAYFSFGFLLLKAYNLGFEAKEVVLLYALFNLSFVIFAPQIGNIGDSVGRKKIILLEYFIYFLMSVGFIFAETKIQIIVLFLLFGIFYAIDESQSKAYITDLEKTKKATAIGLYNFATGIIYFPASMIAGTLWQFNPNYAFVFAAMISAVSFVFFSVQK